MRPSSFLVLAVLLVLGMLVGQAAVSGEADQVLAKGQVTRPGMGHGPVKLPSKPGSCPRILMQCAMMNPPNACMRDSQCSGNKKCCMGSCGRVCMRPKN
ncbi:elafin [Myotis myotis]|uniref:elafin n=1 Tax=Myotis myotis TaxID=51298 RepID=UPI0017492E85|nr:elafin [Myotis myotis]